MTRGGVYARLRLPALLLAVVLSATGAAPATASDEASAGGDPDAAHRTAEPAVEAQSSPSASPGQHGTYPSDEEALATLALAGIAVHAEETTSVPLRPVEGAIVSRLTAWQARNLAAEARAGGGLLGADLDRAIPLGDTGMPFSYLLAAWVETHDSQSSEAMRRVMGEQDWRNAGRLVFPALALTLFSADAAQAALVGMPNPSASPGASRPSASPATSRPTATPRLASDGWAPISLVAVAAPGFGCTTITDFVDRALATVFDALRIDPAGFGNDVPGQLLGFLTGIWNRAIALAEGVVRRAIAELTAPVVGILRTAIGLAALITQVVSYLKPWPVVVEASPSGFSLPFQGDGVSGYFRARADVSPAAEQWPEVLVGCARALGKTLPELAAAGAPIRWDLHVSAPGLVRFEAGSPPFDLRLDADRTSTVRYVSSVDPPGWENGPLLLDDVVASVSIERKELGELRAIIKGITIGQLPREVQSVIAATIGPELDRLLADATSALDPLLQARGRSIQVIVLHRGPPPPTPAPTPTATPRASVWVRYERPASDRVLGGRILELVACEGIDGSWDGYLRTGGLAPTGADPFEVPFAEFPISFRLPSGTGARRVRTTTQGIVETPLADIPLRFELEITLDGAHMQVRALNVTEVEWPAGFERLPIERAPAGACPA